MGVINGFEATEGLDKEKGHQRKADVRCSQATRV